MTDESGAHRHRHTREEDTEESYYQLCFESEDSRIHLS
jgi:hypothetical protein